MEKQIVCPVCRRKLNPLKTGNMMGYSREYVCKCGFCLRLGQSKVLPVAAG